MNYLYLSFKAEVEENEFYKVMSVLAFEVAINKIGLTDIHI